MGFVDNMMQAKSTKVVSSSGSSASRGGGSGHDDGDGGGGGRGKFKPPRVWCVRHYPPNCGPCSRSRPDGSAAVSSLSNGDDDSGFGLSATNVEALDLEPDSNLGVSSSSVINPVRLESCTSVVPDDCCGFIGHPVAKIESRDLRVSENLYETDILGEMDTVKSELKSPAVSPDYTNGCLADMPESVGAGLKAMSQNRSNVKVHVKYSSEKATKSGDEVEICSGNVARVDQECGPDRGIRSHYQIGEKSKVVHKSDNKGELKGLLQAESVVCKAKVAAERHSKKLTVSEEFVGLNVASERAVVVGLMASTANSLIKTQAGIDCMQQGQDLLAVSIVASGGYEDNLDSSDILDYTGHGGKTKDKEAEDQKLEKDNEAERKALMIEYLFDIGGHSDEEDAQDSNFTIDAAEFGNVGRFINHSCSPNLYAQNVLYDHGNRKIPHIMFFAAENIPSFERVDLPLQTIR
ncbi:unnamed protein product [Linum tenue]|uniref:SET domain-containing protein n=1 Tax=Linum tenue TaxID=586396 RepID=A0AAV0Q2S2_9ROSI|nr:unnamed protein product [Linum tenue]